MVAVSEKKKKTVHGCERAATFFLFPELFDLCFIPANFRSAGSRHAIGGRKRSSCPGLRLWMAGDSRNTAR